MNKKEIIWNLINSLIAGLLVFCGAFTTGTVTTTGLIAAASASMIVFLTKFKDYWVNDKSYVFNFL